MPIPLAPTGTSLPYGLYALLGLVLISFRGSYEDAIGSDISITTSLNFNVIEWGCPKISRRNGHFLFCVVSTIATSCARQSTDRADHSVQIRVLTIAIFRACQSTDKTSHPVQLRLNYPHFASVLTGFIPAIFGFWLTFLVPHLNQSDTNNVEKLMSHIAYLQRALPHKNSAILASINTAGC